MRYVLPGYVSTCWWFQRYPWWRSAMDLCRRSQHIVNIGILLHWWRSWDDKDSWSEAHWGRFSPRKPLTSPPRFSPSTLVKRLADPAKHLEEWHSALLGLKSLCQIPVLKEWIIEEIHEGLLDKCWTICYTRSSSITCLLTSYKRNSPLWKSGEEKKKVQQIGQESWEVDKRILSRNMSLSFDSSQRDCILSSEYYSSTGKHLTCCLLDPSTSPSSSNNVGPLPLRVDSPRWRICHDNVKWID